VLNETVPPVEQEAHFATRLQKVTSWTRMSVSGMGIVKALSAVLTNNFL